MKMVFLGPPGAGKGTLAVMAAERLNLVHISTGDLFRAAVKAESELGRQVKEVLARGALVSDGLTISLVKERLSLRDAESGWILDGFPRTIAQAEALQEMNPADKVVNFDVEDSLVLFRLAGRQVCRSCGKIYHLKTLPPRTPGVCDICSGELYTRSDDREESVRTRLEAYRGQTAPLIDWYSSRKLLVTIDGSGAPEVVYARFAETLGI